MQRKFGNLRFKFMQQIVSLLKMVGWKGNQFTKEKQTKRSFKNFVA